MLRQYSANRIRLGGLALAEFYNEDVMRQKLASHLYYDILSGEEEYQTKLVDYEYYRACERTIRNAVIQFKKFPWWNLKQNAKAFILKRRMIRNGEITQKL